MTRQQATAICERLGLDAEAATDETTDIDTLIGLVAGVDYGNGERATAEELAELRRALETVRS